MQDYTAWHKHNHQHSQTRSTLNSANTLRTLKAIHVERGFMQRTSVPSLLLFERPRPLQRMRPPDPSQPLE